MSTNSKVLPLNGQLDKIVKMLQIAPAEQQIFLADAKEIKGILMDGIKRRNELFRDSISGLSLTRSYLEPLRLHIPDGFDLHLKIELNFELTVIKMPEFATCVLLRAPSEYAGKHPIVRSDGFVDRLQLQHWISENFGTVIRGLGIVKCLSGHEYRLIYMTQGQGCAHKIAAIDMQNVEREICFDFVPVFEFKAIEIPFICGRCAPCVTVWLAVPCVKPEAKNDTRYFMICPPHWELERPLRGIEKKLKHVMCLMKALRDAHGMRLLSSFMLKSVFLQALAEKNERFWRRSLAVIFTKMLGRLLILINRKNLEFYLAPDLNYSNILKHDDVTLFRDNVFQLLTNVKSLKAYGHNIPFEDVAVLFGLK